MKYLWTICLLIRLWTVIPPVCLYVCDVRAKVFISNANIAHGLSVLTGLVQCNAAMQQKQTNDCWTKPKNKKNRQQSFAQHIITFAIHVNYFFLFLRSPKFYQSVFNLKWEEKYVWQWWKLIISTLVSVILAITAINQQRNNTTGSTMLDTSIAHNNWAYLLACMLFDWVIVCVLRLEESNKQTAS